MGPARADPDQRALSEAMLSLLDKAGYDVRFPKRLASPRFWRARGGSC